MTPPHDYLRLRQVCLVAADLALAEQRVTQVLGLAVAHRDERVARYGLHNFLVPLGTSFIEVVSPTQPGTAAGRFLDRHAGRHGYMTIYDCSDLARQRERVLRSGIRILHERRWPGYANMHLHPRDTGAVMFEFHHNEGGDALDGHYDPAGPGWQQHVRDDVSVALLAAHFEAPDPLALAQRWVPLFDRPVQRLDDGTFEMPLDNVRLHFAPGEGEPCLAALTVSVRDLPAVLARARAQGCPVQGHAVELCGVWFRLVPAG